MRSRRIPTPRLGTPSKTKSRCAESCAYDTTEYAPIAQLLENGMEAGPLVVDLRGLQFLNSSGISMLMRLAIRARDSRGSLLLRGSKKVPWQSKSMPNLRRIFSEIRIEIE